MHFDSSISDPLHLYLFMGRDYEFTHQLALQVLLYNSSFARLLCAVEGETEEVLIEPDNKKFDLLLATKAGERIYFEMKMRSPVNRGQVAVQKDRISKLNAENSKARLVYILLGPEGAASDGNELYPGQKADIVSYEKLIFVLEQFIKQSGRDDSSHKGIITAKYTLEFAEAYLKTLQEQWDWIRLQKGDGHEWRRYYNLYRDIRKELIHINSAYSLHIKQGTNPGGQVCLATVNLNQWEKVIYNGASLELYVELVEGQMVLKFHFPGEKQAKKELRDRLRAITHQMAPDINFEDYGRPGEYMGYLAVQDVDWKDTPGVAGKIDQLLSIQKEVVGQL